MRPCRSQVPQITCSPQPAAAAAGSSSSSRQAQAPAPPPPPPVPSAPRLLIADHHSPQIAQMAIMQIADSRYQVEVAAGSGSSR
jgi:hypothetical protein